MVLSPLFHKNQKDHNTPAMGTARIVLLTATFITTTSISLSVKGNAVFRPSAYTHFLSLNPLYSMSANHAPASQQLQFHTFFEFWNPSSG
jgi:hypothetical protein